MLKTTSTPEQFQVGEFVRYVYRIRTMYYAQILKVGPKLITIRLPDWHSALSPRRVPRERLRKLELMGEETAGLLAIEISHDKPLWKVVAMKADSFTNGWRVEAVREDGGLCSFECRAHWLQAKPFWVRQGGYDR